MSPSHPGDGDDQAPRSPTSLVTLRSVAIASNVMFVAEAACANLPPVLVLHPLLLPLNFVRLCEALGAREEPS